MLLPSSVLLLVVWFFGVDYANANVYATQCFLPKYHYAVSRASPLAEFWNVSFIDCLTYCILNFGKSTTIDTTCASVVYHRHFSTCQLYGHLRDGSKVIFAAGHDFYNRTDFFGSCSGRSKHSDARIIKYDRPKAYGVRVHSGATPINRDVRDSYKNVPSQEFIFANKPEFACKSNEKQGFLVVRNYALVQSAPVARITGIDRFTCLNYCKANQNSYGDPVECALVSYNGALQKCDLHDEMSKEAHMITRTKYQKFSYVAERFCLPQPAWCRAEQPMLRIIVGAVIKANPLVTYQNTENIMDCVVACIKNPSCKAIGLDTNTCSLYFVNLQKESSRIQRNYNANTAIVDCRC